MLNDTNQEGIITLVLSDMLIKKSCSYLVLLFLFVWFLHHHPYLIHNLFILVCMIVNRHSFQYEVFDLLPVL